MAREYTAISLSDFPCRQLHAIPLCLHEVARIAIQGPARGIRSKIRHQDEIDNNLHRHLYKIPHIDEFMASGS